MNVDCGCGCSRRTGGLGLNGKQGDNQAMDATIFFRHLHTTSLARVVSSRQTHLRRDFRTGGIDG